jgi:hypothetical protein
MADVLSPTSSDDEAADDEERLRQARARRNHLWMLLMALTPVVFGILYVLGVFTGGDPEPVVNPIHTPAGYTGVTDAYFGFAIPKGWTENNAYSDANGDFEYNGKGGWAGERESIQKVSPGVNNPVPVPLQSFEIGVPTPFKVSGKHRVTIPGIAWAYQMTLTRPGGFRAEAINAWEPHSQTELWLMVTSSATVDHTVLSSLQGSAVN